MQVQKWARPSLEMAEWAIQISVGRRHILPILPALFRASRMPNHADKEKQEIHTPTFIVKPDG